MPIPKWIFAFASATGNAHISNNIPCQDACAVEMYEDFVITVVSDGAGSCNNSDRGSKQVTQSCIYHFEKVVVGQGWNTKDKLPSQKTWHKVAKKALIAVRKDLDKFSMSHDFDFKSLSCTVIVTIALPSGLLTTHIGDGRAGYCNFSNEWFSTICPFQGEQASQTVFITSDIWNEDVIDMYIESTVTKNDVKAFCLLSDGCEKAAFECNLFDQEKGIYFDPNRPFPLFFNPNLKILPQLHEQEKTQDEINILWGKFLEAGNEKLSNESDDKTMILCVRIS